HRDAEVWAAKGIFQTLEPGHKIHRCCGGGGRDGKGDTLRPVLFCQTAQVAGSQVQRLIPANTLPAGVGIALWPRALKRIEQPVGVIDKLWRSPSFGTERLACRVRW